MKENILCFDIGGSSLKCAICGKDGTIKHKRNIPMVEDIEGLCEVMKSYKEEMEVLFNLEGVAMSSCGAVHSDTGVIGGTSALPFIHGPSWKKLIMEYLNLPCEIENDANCAALSELYYGQAKEVKDMCFIVIGTGVGGAIVKDRMIHHGAHLYGGEFGMMVAKDQRNNIVNTSLLASTSSMVRNIESKLEGSWDGKRIFNEAENGNQLCIKEINRFFDEVAICVFNIQHMYDPEVILFGGAISARVDFVQSVRKSYEKLCDKISIETLTPKLMCCTYFQDANIIGALANYQLKQ